MMKELFERWIAADNVVFSIKEQITKLQSELAKAETASTEAMINVRDLMQHDGVLEDTVAGELIDYKIYYTVPRESIKVVDPAAVPDEFCKIERKPVLQKIKDFMKEGNVPNWASYELGESKLTYKSIVRR